MAELNNMINNNSNDAASTPESLIKNKDTMFNCTECSSLIELLSISEDKNIIEFKCINKECDVKKTMPIKEYFEKMKKHNQSFANEDTCTKHSSNKYWSYCFDCNCHLCEECLKSREHADHNKNYIIEIKPREEELNIINEVIEYYQIKIDKKNNEKINKIKELKNSLKSEKINEDEKLKKKLELNEIEKSKEMTSNHDKYNYDIEEIKKKYENEIKERENKYKEDEDIINNKYKKMEEKEYNIHKLKLEELEKKYNDIINNLTYDKEIENMANTKKINEVIYNTYNSYNDNYYNSLNINKIILSYFSKKKIKNEIMKKVLNNNYEEFVKIILKKKDADNKINSKKENEEKKDLELNEIKENYEKLKDEKEKLDEKLNDMIKEKEKLKKELEETKMKISYKYIILINIFGN